MNLFDIVGENGFDFLQKLFERTDFLLLLATAKPKQIQNAASTIISHEAQSLASIPPALSDIPLSDMEYEKLSANQKKKLAQREQQALEKAIAASQREYQSERSGEDWLQRMGFSEEFLTQERALGLQKGNGPINRENWTENLAPAGTHEFHEKRGLPQGAERKTGVGFEEVFIPAAKKMAPPGEGESVRIEELEPWAQRAFLGTQRLNRIQSAVFKCAYNSIENMLVCAPTGAGKTNIAMLAFLRLVKSNLLVGDVIDKAAVKAVYIAPMKALAQEVVAKFSERLAPLGLVVREFTGKD